MGSPMEDVHGLEVLQRLRLAAAAATDMELAHKLGLSRQSIAKAKATKSVPAAWIPKASVLFGVSADWLFFGQNAQAPAPQTKLEASSAMPQPMPHMPENVCAACAALKRELELERQERRELTAENRHLWKENSELREKCARLEERQYQRSVEHGDDEAVGSA